MARRPEDIATAVAELRVAYYGRQVRSYAAPNASAVSKAFDTITAYDAAMGEWQAAGSTAQRPEFATF